MRRRGPATAVILHGAGSDAAFVRSAFAAPLARAGYRLIAPDDRTGDPIIMAERLRALLTRQPDVELVGGVSVGAHAVARWAARDARAAGLDGLLFVMPAWTGQDRSTATMTRISADTLERSGVHNELERLRQNKELARDWVMEELSRAWPLQSDTLADTLLRTSMSRGPYASELARITTSVGLVALDDDPLHPAAVATTWARHIKHAKVEHLSRHAPAHDRSVIGVAAVHALQRAQRGH
jgi:pimeloyl-ACP methyl ester carboxylesterase